MKGGLQPPAPSRLPATSGRQRPIYGWLAGFVAGALAMWLVSSQTAALHTFGGQHSSFLIGPRGASGSGNLSSGGSTARSSWRWISATENDPEQVNGVSRNFQTAAAQSMLPALQQRLAQAALEQRWRLDLPPRGAPAGAPPADDPLRIPRILHHVYLPDLGAYLRLAENLTSHTRQRWGQSCVQQHPGWDYVFWDLQAATQLVETHYPGFAEMWCGINSTINQANAIRYFILHAVGGLYLDLDVECWRGSEAWLSGADVVLQGTGKGVTNGVLAGVPGHPLWEAAIQRVYTNWRRSPKMTSGMQHTLTGPTMMKETLLSLGPKPNTTQTNPWVGRHALASGTVVVQPLGGWFMPCLHSDIACHLQAVKNRALGTAPLADLAGYHRYSASWTSLGNSAGIFNMQGLQAAMCAAPRARPGWQQPAAQQAGTDAGASQLPAGKLSAATPSSSSSSSSSSSMAKVLLPIKARADIGAVLEREGLQTGAELGVQAGFFADQTLKVWKSCTKYYLVDLWGHQENYNDVANVDAAEQEKKYQATRQRLAPYSDRTVFIRNYTTHAATQIPDNSLDYVYVDARHDYCGVHEDLAAYWPKLRSGGILAGHDYLDAPEVAAKPSPRKQDWSLCMDGSRHQGAVKGAVNEFAQQHGLTLLVTYNEPNFPSWMARKP